MRQTRGEKKSLLGRKDTMGLFTFQRFFIIISLTWLEFPVYSWTAIPRLLPQSSLNVGSSYCHSRDSGAWSQCDMESTPHSLLLRRYSYVRPARPRQDMTILWTSSGDTNEKDKGEKKSQKPKKSSQPSSSSQKKNSANNSNNAKKKNKKSPKQSPTMSTTNANQKKQSPQSKPKHNQSSSSKQKHKNKNNNTPNNKKKPKKSFLKSLRSTLQTIDPFEAGYQFRRELTTINRELNSAITTFTGVRSDVDAENRILPENLYYLNDRLFALETSTNSKEEEDELLPEILVVGAVTKIGIIVVKKLLLKGMRVRVLVPNLYSSTLNLLGTNVVYFQGDLSNVESLEYALTDVDKIVFCEGDEISTEMDRENHTTINNSNNNNLNRNRNGRSGGSEDVDWMGMQKLLHAYQNVRFADYGAGQAAKRSLFKLKDRPEDFNLFAIDQEEQQQSQEEEEENDWEEEYAAYKTNNKSKQNRKKQNTNKQNTNKQNALWCRWMKNKFDHGVFIGSVSAAGNTIAGGQGEAAIVSTRLRARKKKTPPPPSTTLSSTTTTETTTNTTTTTTTSDNGIDLSRGFAGFVCRLCGDGKKYEAFVRTGDYDKYGVEYVHEFQTVTKPVVNNTKPPMETTNSGRERAGKARRDLPKFITVRMPFKGFTPRLQNPEVLEAVLENEKSGDNSTCFVLNLPPFDGKDVRQIGFRFRSSANEQQSSSSSSTTSSQNDKSKLKLSRSALNTLASNSNTPQSSMPMKQFYLALCYIKLYRANYEPEFVYLSDSRIPPKVKRNMVRHDVKMIVSSDDDDENGVLNGDHDSEEDGDLIVSVNGGRGGGQTDPNGHKEIEVLHHDLEKEKPYYKYRGEQLLRNSGLSYSIVRVPDFNESPSSEISTIKLQQTNGNLISSVSRADVAEVCAACLLDPTACNVAFYVNKATRGETRLVGNNGASSISSLDEDMSAKFARLSADS